MAGFVARARFASLLAVACALLLAATAFGAAGDFLKIGFSNDSGASQTVLLNAGLGAAFTLKTTNVSTGATGIFGWSSQTGANATRGVYGKADGPNSYGVFGRQSGAMGTGAAVYAEGNNNVGVSASSTDTNAIEATGACDGFCAAAGIYAQGAGFTAAVFGVGEGSFTGVWGNAPDTYAGWGVVGLNSEVNGVGVLGTSSGGPGVEGDSDGAGTINLSCGDGDGCFDYPGGAFAAHVGVIGQTNGIGPNGFSRGVIGIAADAGFYGVYSIGDAVIAGDLTITGNCSGCVLSVVAKNGSNQAIRQGDAVTLVGATTADDGSITVLVAPAKKGDAILGIADRALTLSPATVTTKPISHKQPAVGKGMITVTSPSVTVEAKDRKWLAGGTSAAANGFLRVITSGLLAFDTTTAPAASVGDSLAVGATAGTLGKASADTAKGATAGTFIGKLGDGRVVLFVQPH